MTSSSYLSAKIDHVGVRIVEGKDDTVAGVNLLHDNAVQMLLETNTE